jgi:uncharacterized protein YbjQ (UPF0145 family)
MSNLFAPKLVFLCAPDFGQFWRKQGLEDLFLGDTQIVLRCDREDYQTPVQGERNVFVDYFGGVRVQVGTQRLTFKASIKDPRETALIMMTELAKPPGGNQQVILTCYDYHRRVDRNDMVRGFRIRQGILHVDSGTGTLSQGYIHCPSRMEVVPANRQYYTQGFGLEFIEKERDIWNLGG